MRKPSQRIRQLLAPLLEAAVAVKHLDQPSPPLTTLQDAVFDCLRSGDGELLDALLQTLRETGYTELWEYLWRAGIHLATAKFRTEGDASVLVGIPLYRDWYGTLTAEDRKDLTQVLKESGVLPPRGKLYWFPQPISLPTLLELGPMELWDLNTPGQTAPRFWGYQRTIAPVIQVLLGRLEYRRDHPPAEWPEPYVLAHRQAEILDLPEEALGACQPLGLLLSEQLDTQRCPDPLQTVLLSIAHATLSQIHQQHWSPKDCRVLVSATHEGHPEIFLRGPQQESLVLATIDLAALSLRDQEFVQHLRLALEPAGIKLLWIPASESGNPLH